MFSFSVSDSAAVPTSVLKEESKWTLSQRRDFAECALIALAEFTESSERTLLHRALDAESVRVRAETPIVRGLAVGPAHACPDLERRSDRRQFGCLRSAQLRSN